MIRIGLGFIVVGVAASAAMAAGSASRPITPRVGWRDLAGVRNAPRNHPASLLIFTSTTCPCADGYSSRIRRLEEHYGPRGVASYLVFSAGAGRAEVERYVRRREFRSQAVLDSGGRLAARYGAKATPTAVVLRRDGSVAYRGALDDNPESVAVTRSWVREALEAALAGREAVVKRTVSLGCAIGPDAKPASSQKPAAGGPAEGLGPIHFAITAKPAAQRFFDQGLARWYSFNFVEAEKSFRRALREDPRAAMAQWGIALALGMNYNYDFDPSRLPEAYRAIHAARRLTTELTPREQALIRNLAIRHSSPGALDLDGYYRSMLATQREYSDSADIAVLTAAAGMDLHPWDLYSLEGKAREETPRLEQLLERAIQLEPGHVGAHHYYIHATEASNRPDRALESARKLADLAPQSGHLVHMPSHTFWRVGDYENAARWNQRASGVDLAYLNHGGKGNRYGSLYIHVLDFAIASFTASGRAQEALEASANLSKEVAKFAPGEKAMWCGSVSSPIWVNARFHRWDAILKADPPSPDNWMALVPWHYARGLALTARGDLAGAEAELEKLDAAVTRASALVPETPLAGVTQGLRLSFKLPSPMLRSRIREKQGRMPEAEAELLRGREIEASVPYMEPPFWRHPFREALGFFYLRRGKNAEAERAFANDLRRNPNSGRSLFGQSLALDRLGRPAFSNVVENLFRSAWSRADSQPDPNQL